MKTVFWVLLIVTISFSASLEAKKSSLKIEQRKLAQLLSFVNSEARGLALVAYCGDLEVLRDMLPDEVTEVNKEAMGEAFFLAAYSGQENSMELIIAHAEHLGIELDYLLAVTYAAYGGQNEAVEFLKEKEKLTAEEFLEHGVLSFAVQGGLERTINILKRIVAPKIGQLKIEEKVAANAAFAGHKKIMAEAIFNMRELGDYEYDVNNFLISAADGGYLKTVKVAIAYGANDFGAAIRTALKGMYATNNRLIVSGDHIEVVDYLLSIWEKQAIASEVRKKAFDGEVNKEPFDRGVRAVLNRVLREFAYDNNIEGMQFVIERGANDFDGAFESAVDLYTKQHLSAVDLYTKQHLSKEAAELAIEHRATNFAATLLDSSTPVEAEDVINRWQEWVQEQVTATLQKIDAKDKLRITILARESIAKLSEDL